MNDFIVSYVVFQKWGKCTFWCKSVDDMYKFEMGISRKSGTWQS